MTLDPDHITDRRRLKRRLTFWRVVAVLALLVAAAAGFARFDGLTRDGVIARYTIEGVILDDRRRDAALERIGKNDDVRALLVRIDSPGGTVAGGEALFRTLRRVKTARVEKLNTPKLANVDGNPGIG